MLTLLIVVGALITLVVLALVFLPSFVDNDAIIALAQEQVRTATGGELVVAGDTAQRGGQFWRYRQLVPRAVIGLHGGTRMI